MNPVISVIIPIYNAGKYLRPALESVLNQNFSDWECICVNDGSTDDSAAVVREFVSLDPRFVLIDGIDNLGVSVARNSGMRAAGGEYVTFLDQDDLLAPGALSAYVGLLRRYNADMVRGRYKLVPEDFCIGISEKYLDFGHRYFNNAHAGFIKITSKKKYRKWMYLWLCAFRKDAIKNVCSDARLKSFGGDVLFMAGALECIKDFVQSDAVTTFHRQSLISQTQNGFHPGMVSQFKVMMPVIHEKFAGKKSKWAKWFCAWEMNNAYRWLVRRPVKENKNIELAHETLASFSGGPAMMWEHLNWNRRMQTRMFMRKEIDLLGHADKISRDLCEMKSHIARQIDEAV